MGKISGCSGPRSQLLVYHMRVHIPQPQMVERTGCMPEMGKLSWRQDRTGIRYEESRQFAASATTA